MQEIGCSGVFGCMNTARQLVSNLDFRLRLRATAEATSTLRARLRGWLWSTGASADECLDLQLACTEVLTMVIRDAAALVVEVEGRVQGGIVSVAFREYGLCRNVNRIDLDQEGIFSVALIQAVADDLDIRAHPDGRTVVLSRRLERGVRGGPLDHGMLSGA